MSARTPVARDLVSGEEWEREAVRQRRSPDGTKTYESRRLPGGDTIIERNTSSGTERELLRLPGAGAGAIGKALWHLTGDGRSIVATTTDPATGAGLVILCSLEDGTVKELFRAQGAGPQEISMALWEPGDRSILVRSSGGASAVTYWWVPLDGRQPKPLDELTGLEVETQNGRHSFELHPDGRRLAFYVGNHAPAAEEVWVLENFLPTANGRGAGGR